jgi:hypothetical protein
MEHSSALRVNSVRTKSNRWASIHKDDVKALGVVGKMGECSKGSLFDEPEPFSA